MANPGHVADIGRILDLMPHRYPFLLVDRVRAFEKLERIEALKNVTINEPFFQGHFPGKPVMPGVLILEAMAQTGGLLVLLSEVYEDFSKKVFMFTSVEKARFRRPVMPGDQLVIKLGDLKNKFNIWKMSGTAEVDGEVAAEATMTAAIVDRSEV